MIPAVEIKQETLPPKDELNKVQPLQRLPLSWKSIDVFSGF